MKVSIEVSSEWNVGSSKGLQGGFQANPAQNQADPGKPGKLGNPQLLLRAPGCPLGAFQVGLWSAARRDHLLAGTECGGTEVP